MLSVDCISTQKFWRMSTQREKDAIYREMNENILYALNHFDLCYGHCCDHSHLFEMCVCVFAIGKFVNMEIFL